MRGKKSTVVALLALLVGVAVWLLPATRSVPPRAEENGLRILSPTILEITRMTIGQPDGQRVGGWDFIARDGTVALPKLAQFFVVAERRSIAVEAVGFKRRPLSAPLGSGELRIESRLYLRLASPLKE